MAVYEQPVRPPHPDFDAGLAGRVLRVRGVMSLAHYLNKIRAMDATVERVPADDDAYKVTMGDGVIERLIYHAHPGAALYRYKLLGEVWSYVLLWEA